MSEASRNKNGNFRRRDYRHHCGRLLFRAYLPPGTHLHIRCSKCGKGYQVKIPIIQEELETVS